jgi:hypothetical protein
VVLVLSVNGVCLIDHIATSLLTHSRSRDAVQRPSPQVSTRSHYPSSHRLHLCSEVVCVDFPVFLLTDCVSFCFISCSSSTQWEQASHARKTRTRGKNRSRNSQYRTQASPRRQASDSIAEDHRNPHQVSLFNQSINQSINTIYSI